MYAYTDDDAVENYQKAVRGAQLEYVYFQIKQKLLTMKGTPLTSFIFIKAIQITMTEFECIRTFGKS